MALNQCGLPPPVPIGMWTASPFRGRIQAGAQTIDAAALKHTVFLSHLVARKGRKASDRSGDGG